MAFKFIKFKESLLDWIYQGTYVPFKPYMSMFSHNDFKFFYRLHVSDSK